MAINLSNYKRTGKLTSVAEVVDLAINLSAIRAEELATS